MSPDALPPHVFLRLVRGNLRQDDVISVGASHELRHVSACHSLRGLDSILRYMAQADFEAAYTADVDARARAMTSVAVY